MQTPARIQAWDVSPNHSAVVEIDYATGEMLWHNFAQTKIRAHAKYKESFLLPEHEKVGKAVKSCTRILELLPIFRAWAARPNVALIAIEDYAMGAAQGAHFIGEIGGLARLAAFERKIPVRLWGLKSIKKFLTASGNATKPQMKESAMKAGAPFNYGAIADEDLCDAFGLAKLVHAEMRLRITNDTKFLQAHEKDVLTRKMDDGTMVYQRPLLMPFSCT